MAVRAPAPFPTRDGTGPPPGAQGPTRASVEAGSRVAPGHHRHAAAAIDGAGA